MTVSSLWKVLDDAGCGKAVGIREILDPELTAHEQIPGAINTWNVNEQRNSIASVPPKPITLAVDLSIWICESLTSQASSDNHTNPAVHLVFTRTAKLLSYGIKLIVVVEGKRRIRAENGMQDKLRKCRSGTDFWKACRDCKYMLEMLGVPVFQAKAEGEALCALLNQRGIVDGVISNDGDCLVFGARVLYTRFSIENLDNSQVIRYDLNNLAARIRATDAEDISLEEVGTVSLDRADLISFAILTGSDLAGNGFPNVGYFKAVRFIRKSKLDNPLRSETASIDELVSWEKAARFLCNEGKVQPENELSRKERTCCSRCCHQGDKRTHEKYGCKQCGTEPGEPCWVFGKEDRFRKNLREKALILEPKFEPSQVRDAYMRPNENQIPYNLVGFTSRSIAMHPPNLEKLMNTKLIIKGRSIEKSKEFVKQVTWRLLSRLEILRICQGEQVQQDPSQAAPIRFSRSQPVPTRIVRALTKKDYPFYEVKWKVEATLADEEGNGVDGYEYSTIEPQDMIKNCFPQLCKDYDEAEKERLKQGDGQQENRRMFLRSLCIDVQAPVENEAGDEPKSPGKRKKPCVKKREAFFKTKGGRPRIPLSVAKRTKTGKEAGFLLRCIGRHAIGRLQQLDCNDHRITVKNKSEVRNKFKSSSTIESDHRDPFLNRTRQVYVTENEGTVRHRASPKKCGVPKVIILPESIEESFVQSRPQGGLLLARAPNEDKVPDEPVNKPSDRNVTVHLVTQGEDVSSVGDVDKVINHGGIILARGNTSNIPLPPHTENSPTNEKLRSDSLFVEKRQPIDFTGGELSLSNTKTKTFWSLGGIFVAMSPIQASRNVEPPGIRLDM
ncbi:hypothetical protein ACA910_016836 [Epithemia clementina (nom. ined.)]